MGNMGMATYLKLSAGASQQSNLAAIMSALSTVTDVLKTTNSEDLHIETLWESEIGICFAELGHALSLSSWANLLNDICPLASGLITTVKDTFSYCFRGAPTKAIVPPTPVAPMAAVPPPLI
jgi:hypothetical protein